MYNNYTMPTHGGHPAQLSYYELKQKPILIESFFEDVNNTVIRIPMLLPSNPNELLTRLINSDLKEINLEISDNWVGYTAFVNCGDIERKTTPAPAFNDVRIARMCDFRVSIAGRRMFIQDLDVLLLDRDAGTLHAECKITQLIVGDSALESHNSCDFHIDVFSDSKWHHLFNDYHHADIQQSVQFREQDRVTTEFELTLSK